jgi:cell wall-associated NlpC family hydrolase
MRLAALLVAALVAGCASSPETMRGEPRDDPLPALPAERAADVVLTAMSFLDTPYRRGGNSVEQGFDCSGFTRHVYAQTLALTLPRRAEDQALWRALREVERAALAAGDLVFFNTLRRTHSHVGIYLGDGKFIHAPRTGAAVRVEDMRSPYWASRYDGGRRVALAGPAPTAE